jgi:hypothetical protein
MSDSSVHRRSARSGAEHSACADPSWRRRNLNLRALVPRFKFHFRVTAGRGGGYDGGYFFEMQFYDGPLRRAEDDKGDAAAGQVLLVAHVFIGGDNDIETGRLGRGEQVAIAESIPTAIFGSRDRVTDKRACDALRRHMVKENEHRGRSRPALALERRGYAPRTQAPR